MSIESIKTRGQAIKEATELEEVTNIEVGDLFIDVAESMRSMSGLAIRKTYPSEVDMYDDVLNPIGDDGNPILEGNLVACRIDANNAAIYSYVIDPSDPTRRTWVFVSNMGIPADMARTGGYDGTLQDLDNTKLGYNLISQPYLHIVTDSEGRILSAYKKDGAFMPLSLILPDKTINQIKGIIESYPIVESTKLIESRDLEIKLDGEGRILSRYLPDGTFAPSKIRLPNEAKEDIKDYIGNTVGLYNQEGVKPFPTSLIRIDFYGDFSGMTKEIGKWIKAKIMGEELDVFMAKQGTSSWNMPKEQYSIDMYKDGKEFKLKIGDWVSQDSFHLKAYYIDAQHCLDIISNRLYGQMLLTKPYNEQRPWRSIRSADESMGSSSSSLDNKIDTGALGYVDGFPYAHYENNVFKGIRTFRLKKHRDNYMMNKSSESNIHFELNVWAAMNQYPVPWDRMEIRTPKGFDTNVEPSVGIVKSSIERLWNWSYNLTDNNFINEYTDYINLSFWIDWILFCELIYANDLVGKNTQWCTWDGNIWFPLPYDLDSTFGMIYNGTSIAYEPTRDFIAKEMYQQPIAMKIINIFSDRLEDRYRELREKNVFSVDNIGDMFAQYMALIGKDMYKVDQELYPTMPSIPFASLNQKIDWISKRIVYLDGKYNYNQ